MGIKNNIIQKHILSKSTFVQGKQCKKMLYLNKHNPKDKKKFKKQTQMLFSLGKDFEQTFRKKFDNAIHLKETAGNKYHLYAEHTEKLLQKSTNNTLFEAGFIYKQVLVLTDVLQRNDDNTFTIYEIKYTNKLKPVVIWDLSLQYYVCKNVLKNIESFNVVLKGKKGKFRISNMTNLLEKNLKTIASEVEEFKNILEEKEAPDVKIGSQCFRPYECLFFDFCRK